MNMSDIVEYYYSTVNSKQPEGNMKEVAEHFQITRAKVQKILFTMEAIDSPLHQDIVKLKDQGYTNSDIAAMLGISTATVSINLPYAKPMYGTDEKSQGAVDVENFRKREKIFLAGQKRKPSYFDNFRKMAERIKQEFPSDYSDSSQKKIEPDTHYELSEDMMNLLPLYTEDESQFFQTSTDVMVLHIELMGAYDTEILKKYGGVKYGSTVSRDLLVHCEMPLHNLHYLIQQIFGFQNYHLHHFQIPQEQLVKITDGKAKNWLSLMGVIFKNPLRNEGSDFWDDDYDGGSPKKYMRSKYTGPYQSGVYDETYQWCRRDADRIRKIIKKEMASLKKKDVLQLGRIFENDPFDLLERLTLVDVLAIEGDEIPDSFEAYMEDEAECIEEIKTVDVDDVNSQPFVYPVADRMIYTYDYGDNWQFSVTPVTNVQKLVDSGRIKLKTLRDDIKYLCECQRPVLLAADGFNLVEDVGGPSGYCAFLNGIHGKDCGGYPYDEAKESLEWAKSLGWKDKVPGRTIV